jgi:hypothetical protein
VPRSPTLSERAASSLPSEIVPKILQRGAHAPVIAGGRVAPPIYPSVSFRQGHALQAAANFVGPPAYRARCKYFSTNACRTTAPVLMSSEQVRSGAVCEAIASRRCSVDGLGRDQRGHGVMRATDRGGSGASGTPVARDRVKHILGEASVSQAAHPSSNRPTFRVPIHKPRGGKWSRTL